MSSRSAEAGGSVLKGSVNAPVFVPGKSPAGKASPGSGNQAPGKQGPQQSNSKGSGGKVNAAWAAAVAQSGLGSAGSSAKLSAAALSAPVFVPKTVDTPPKPGAAAWGDSGKNASANSTGKGLAATTWAPITSAAAVKQAANSSTPPAASGKSAGGAAGAGKSSTPTSSTAAAGKAVTANSNPPAGKGAAPVAAAAAGLAASAAVAGALKASAQSPRPGGLDRKQQQQLQYQERQQNQNRQHGRQQQQQQNVGRGSKGGAASAASSSSTGGSKGAASAAAAAQSSPTGVAAKAGSTSISNSSVSQSSGSSSVPGGAANAGTPGLKMSASAAAFVPGKSAAPGPAAASTPQGKQQQQQTPQQAGAPGQDKQQQQPPPPLAPQQQQAGSNRGANAVLRSPGRVRSFGSMGGSSYPHMPNSGRGRGGRPSLRMDFNGPAGRGPMGLGAFHNMLGGLGVSPAFPPGPPGMKRGPPAALASHQGNYFQPQGVFQAGPGRQLMAGRFMSETLRQQLQQHNYLVQAKWSGMDESSIVEKVNQFHTLYPLEDPSSNEEQRMSAVLGVRTMVVKGVNAHDGQGYVLRVVDGKQVLPSLELLSAARQSVDTWMILSGHPNLVCPCEAFVSSDWDGTPSLVMVYPYHAGSVTLAQAHLLPTQTVSGQLVRNQPPSEETLWGYTVQLACALRAVHAAGLAVRAACLNPSKVLVTPLGRLRVNCLGLVDALNGDGIPQNPEELLMAQREDVVSMGQLLMALACSMGAVPLPSLDYVSMHYSPDFVRLLALLLGVADGGVFSWRHLIAVLGERILQEHDSLSIFNDHLVADLSLEMENGRLFRLMAKLDFINERPEGDMMAAWSETGDRYLLKLFRDFVFHQAADDGSPKVDWGHVVECLNKLDMGAAEEVMLMSRDEQSLLVVTYADIKRCLENAYEELRGGTGQVSGSGAAVGPLGSSSSTGFGRLP